MDSAEREKILAQGRARRAQQQQAPMPAPAAAPRQQPYVRAATGDAQIRVIDENNPPTPRPGAPGAAAVPVGRAMGARVVDPNDLKPGPRIRGARAPGQYGAVVVGGQQPPNAMTVGQALRQPMRPGMQQPGMPAMPAHGGVPGQPSARPVPGRQVAPQQTAQPSPFALGLMQPPAPAPNAALAAQMDAFQRQAMTQGMQPGQPLIMSQPMMGATVADVTVIMSQHARPDTLDRQYRAIRASGVEDHMMRCWVNPANPPKRLNDTLLVKVPHVKANFDMGPWMRWTLVAAAMSKYILMIDDDCVPGPRWLATAVARLEEAEQQGHAIIIAAAGTVYQSDDPASISLVGSESLHRNERDVDVGRGAWIMRADMARLVLNAPKYGCPLSMALHISASLQQYGITTVVLPYMHENHEAWGMLEAAKDAGSLSSFFDLEAQHGRGPGAGALKVADYDVYRSQGWEPQCVMEAEAQAAPPPAPAPEPTAAPQVEAPAT